MDSNNYLFKYGTVVDINDSFDGDRIKVYVKGIDPPNFTLDDIPYAFPFMPKALHLKPKIGESVFVLTQDGSFDGDRFYFGPIISQPHKLDGDTLTSLSFLTAGLIKPDIAPSTDPNNIGVTMDPEDVGLQGRGSTDVILKSNEIRIRAGKSLDLRTYNRDNPSYIQVKYDRSTNKGAVNIISDNINLLSHGSIDKFDLANPDSLISDEEYSKIISKAHQLPFGDVLIELINLIIKALTTHVHAYAGLPPDLNQIEIKTLLAFELEKILSKNIRIN